MGYDGFVGREMNGFHKPPGLIGANGDKRGVYRAKPAAYLLQKIAVPRIARKVDVAQRRMQYVSAPEGFIAVEQAPARKMAGRHARQGKLLVEAVVLPPVQVYGFVNMIIMQQLFNTERHNECGIMPPMEILYGLNIQVVVMIVADEYRVDGREVLKIKSRRTHSPGTYPLVGAGAVAPDRVREDIHSIKLQQKSSVVNKCDPKFAAVGHAGRPLDGRAVVLGHLMPGSPVISRAPPF